MSDEPHSHVGDGPDTTGVFGSDDDIVDLVQTDAFLEAEVVAEQLRANGIPAVVYGVGTAGMLGPIEHMEGSRVMVRRQDVDAAAVIAQEVLEREQQPVSEGDDAELSRLAEESAEPAGWVDPDTGAQV